MRVIAIKQSVIISVMTTSKPIQLLLVSYGSMSTCMKVLPVPTRVKPAASKALRKLNLVREAPHLMSTAHPLTCALESTHTLTLVMLLTTPP
jgi:hypothetical protein